MLSSKLTRARTHNLKNVSLELGPGELIALTGPSGAGKSSLAIDTLYAEGQRRFVESFSPYVRQFLERLERPPMDELAPVAAGVCVDRKNAVRSSRSTLATLTDIEPYLAALFSKSSRPYCDDCNLYAVEMSAEEGAKQLSKKSTRALIGYRRELASREHYLELRDSLAADGYRKLVVNGVLADVDTLKPSVAAKAKSVDVVVDRVQLEKESVRRIQEAVEVAWSRGNDAAIVRLEDHPDEEPIRFVRGLSCPGCARSFKAPGPAMFSYNSPVGACAACKGFGRVLAVDWDKVFPDPDCSIDKGAVRAWAGKSATWERGALKKFCEREKIPTNVAWGKLSESDRNKILEGEGGFRGGKFPGIKRWFEWMETRVYKMHVRVFLARFRQYSPCPTCGTSRLNRTALSYRVGELNLASWHKLSVDEAHKRAMEIETNEPQGKLALEEFRTRLRYLESVGLGYLTLDRQARTLSGGETQRASLTTALGASLTGTLFVLDEPSVGLHASDIPRLGDSIMRLADAGNSVVLIEHDRALVERCSRVVELGPGAGVHGGNILYDGPTAAFAKCDLPTPNAWRKKATPFEPKKVKAFLRVFGAKANNLKDINVDFPVQCFTVVTGASGSGKSTLVEDVVYRTVARALGDSSVDRAKEVDRLEGVELFSRTTLVDQSPLGRTARGNAATYTKAWDHVRKLFASERLSKLRGFEASHFSFNVGGDRKKSGRCEACAGEGHETVEMQFLADVHLKCPECKGKRFRQDVLDVKVRGLSIADVLDATVDEAVKVFAGEGPLTSALEALQLIGLGYLPLGQPLSTLSGGEAQRIKLARALTERADGNLFIVDEPSAGLHASDVEKVVTCLRRLVREGATVVAVEHDLAVMSEADWIIDLGPGGGPHGGEIGCVGTPNDLRVSDTRTGRAMRGEYAKQKKQADKGRNLPPEVIGIVNAREHNLKNVSCEIPRGTLVVVTGPSGSGKSSLVFDVVYAEGQRRFMETLTPYARQFLPSIARPDVDRVTGVPPAIALEQRLARAGANSTVATVTEVAHYLRLLYAKVGVLGCPNCKTPVESLTRDELFERLQEKSGTFTVYAPAVRARKGTYLDVFTHASRAKVQTARVDGKIIPIEPPPKLAKSKEHTIELIVHYGKMSGLSREAFLQALEWGEGSLLLSPGEPSAARSTKETVHSIARTCTTCGLGLPELDPRWFSFNTKQGQCAGCLGLGVLESGKVCGECEGTRLAPIPRNVRLFGKSYPEIQDISVEEARKAILKWEFFGSDRSIAEAAHQELRRRLEFIADVGLGYLSLGRAANTLSGGELQRLRLSAQLGSGLTGALYVLDEPTIGLHPKDTSRLVKNLRRLVDTGCSVVVVEHDLETIRAADVLLDLGPSGGRGGGNICAIGPAKEVLAGSGPTALAIREHEPKLRPQVLPGDKWIEVTGARSNNLKDVHFKVPVGRLTSVVGVSGSGKSTLVRTVFLPALRKALKLAHEDIGAYDTLKGAMHVKRALAVDQSPIGRTPRSVPATFLGVWDEVRKLFASIPEAKARGYKPNRFSFNAGPGRCPSCEGQGSLLSEMAYLPDVVSVCETCRGLRFEPATLDVQYKGYSAGELLKKTVEEAAEIFSAINTIARPLSTLRSLGVGYIALGQGSNTLSGGEAQRLKLAAELTAGSKHEASLYVLDEPTTGLHLSDVRLLVSVLERLIERQDTLVVVEHNTEVIRSSDWVIELGPESGSLGGRIVFEGTPKALAKAKTSTGWALRNA